MKIMIRRSTSGALSAYVPKKDLEESIVAMEKEGMWGGMITLSNGWRLALPDMAVGTHLPITVEARRIGDDWMKLTMNSLDQIEAIILGAAPVLPLVAIRSACPGLSVSSCDADDIRGETIYRTVGGFHLYLVNTHGHCWRIVDSPETAGGLVFAKANE